MPVFVLDRWVGTASPWITFLLQTSEWNDGSRARVAKDRFRHTRDN